MYGLKCWHFQSTLWQFFYQECVLLVQKMANMWCWTEKPEREEEQKKLKWVRVKQETRSSNFAETLSRMVFLLFLSKRKEPWLFLMTFIFLWCILIAWPRYIQGRCTIKFCIYKRLQNTFEHGRSKDAFLIFLCIF